MTPLVSCICPTRNRAEFLPLVVDCFLRQDYPNKELIVLDDSDGGIPNAVFLREEDGGVRYVRINPPKTIGQKRNFCCDFAKGDLVCHFDDDDWQAPDRISRQVAALQSSDAQATAYQTMLFARDLDRKVWRFTGNAQNVVGVSLMYRRSWWKQHQFNESLPFGEDHSFVQMLGPRLLVADQERIVARIHPGNTCKRTEHPRQIADGTVEPGNLANREFWQPADWNEVLSLGYEEAVVCA